MKHCIRTAWAQRQPFSGRAFPICTIKPFTIHPPIARATVPYIAKAKMSIPSRNILLAALRRHRSHTSAIGHRKSLNRIIYIWAVNFMENPNQKATEILHLDISIIPSIGPQFDDRINRVSLSVTEMSAQVFIVENMRSHTMRHVQPRTSKKRHSNIRETRNRTNSINQLCNKIDHIECKFRFSAPVAHQRHRRSILNTFYYVLHIRKYFIQWQMY